MGQPSFSVPRRHAVLELPVLGVPVRFVSNSREILAVVGETFEDLDSPPARMRRRSQTVPSVHILIHAGDERLDSRTALQSRLESRDRFVVAAPASHGIADAARMVATAHVTPTLLAKQSLFRYGVVEALTLFLVTRCDRTPFHASGVTRDGATVLLAGSSGVGKSSLAYAAMRAGMRLLSDDVVYVQREGRTRLWSIARHIRLPADAGELFPELRGVAPVIQPNGKRKVVVEVGSAEARARSPIDPPVGVCILSRKRGLDPVLEPISTASVGARLTAELEPGFDLFGDELTDVLTRLTSGGAWHLTLNEDPTSAVPLLESVLERLRRPG